MGTTARPRGVTVPKAHRRQERPQRLITQSDAADMLGVSVDTIRRRIADGSIRGFRVGRAVRVCEADAWRLARPIPVTD